MTDRTTTTTIRRHGDGRVQVVPNPTPRRFYVKEFAFSPDVPPLADFVADTPTDALALYSLAHGFSDPRQFIGTEEDFYYTMPDGTVGMVFTNTEVYAEAH